MVVVVVGTCTCKDAWVVMVVEVVETYTCKQELVGEEICTCKVSCVVVVEESRPEEAVGETCNGRVVVGIS